MEYKFSHLHHSMANVKIYKCLAHIFTLALTVSDIKYLNFLPSKVGQSHGVQFSQLHHSMANVKIYKCIPNISALTVTISEIEKFKIVYLQKHVEVTEGNFRNYINQRKMSTITNVSHTFLCQLLPFEI